MPGTGTTDLFELVVDCPACAATGWWPAVSLPAWAQADRPPGELDDLQVPCPVCFGRSWVPAVADEVVR